MSTPPQVVRDVNHEIEVIPSRDTNLSPANADDGGGSFRKLGQNFTEIWNAPVEKDWRGGLIRLDANIQDGDPALDTGGNGYGVSYGWSFVEFRVMGYVGSRGEALHRCAVGRFTGAADVMISRVQAYSRIAVTARYVIGGSAGYGGTTNPGTASASAFGRFVRS
jgi:hypothetical protein